MILAKMQYFNGICYINLSFLEPLLLDICEDQNDLEYRCWVSDGLLSRHFAFEMEGIR